ncbi:MAG: ABC transporter ATP-binding protein [Prevotella sp.]|nr:ABC transporter ATP-binding protein [Prevotella sp.]
MFKFKREDPKYSVPVILKWLWKAWRGNRLQAFLNALIGLLGAAVSLAQVSAMRHAINVAAGVDKGSIYWAVGMMAALILTGFGLSIASTWIHNILGIRAQNRMQQQMLDRILRSEWQGKENRHSGDMLNRLELDVGSVVHFLTEVIPGALSTTALFIGAFYYMYCMDSHIALVIVVLVPIFVGLSRIYVPKMRALTREVRDSDSKVQSVLQETIQNRILIKTLESDDLMVGRLEDTQSELRHKVVKRTAFRVMSGFIVRFGFFMGYIIAFLWSALRLSTGTLTYGDMTAFLQLVNRIQSPAHSLMQLVPHFVSVFTAAERLMELEEDPLEEQGSPIYMKSPCGIRLENVTYAYPSSHEQLSTIENLSFDFKPGTCTAILGETGAGKTTLIRLILSLLKPQKGHIQVYNQKNKREMSPRLRCNFVYVPQGNTLLSGTIRENLRLGSINATDQDMYNALHLACADFVKEFPEGLDTVCTEKGGGLSEGQAQRIAIARALLRNRPIMLFDEATSALDPETERKLLENILGQRNRTVLFITHRPAVVDYCDQVMRI